ncbi:MAG TPA: Gfo/Idh/MocA family oxidoreductase, partial [Afifellaceae bacterium]|nr:Gfo/Idh/MocA family oxidoreductase [Afifellaceae bacterium]
MDTLGIGLIGSGFMGASHAFALATVGQVFDLPKKPRLEMLGDADEKLAEAAARRFGFARATVDWRALIADPAVDVVHITAPNRLHVPMAKAAIAAGKAVHCEKPLAENLSDATALADLAEQAGITSIVGFNYLKNPIQALARDLIAAGEIGDIVSFRGIHAEDYMRDPDAAWSWRLDPAGGGATMDLGSHIVSLARFLVGDIARVSAHATTVFPARPGPDGKPTSIEVDDQCQALLEFAGGASGAIQANWLAAGQTMQLAYEIVGTKGSIGFTQARFNELRLYQDGTDARTAGFRTITAGPAHEPYAAFCPAPGHQLGFNDLKTIEMRDFLTAVANGDNAFPDFREAARIQAVIDAVLTAARE